MANFQGDSSSWECVIDYLDNELSGSSLISSKYIDDLERASQEEKKNLETQLLFMKRHNQENLGKRNAKIKEFVDNATAVAEEVNKIRDEVSAHLSNNEDNYKELNNLLKQIKDIDKCSRYFAYIAELEEVSSLVQSAMLIENVDQAVDHFTTLVIVAEHIKDTKCVNLCNYVHSTVIYWYKILLDSLSGEMEQTLQAFGWPFIVTSMKSVLPVNAVQLKENVGVLINRLMNIQLPDFLSSKIDSTFKCESKHDICLPMQFFLVPFRIRFNFHFGGERKTNDIERPEWYFTQVNLYLTDHKTFLVDKLQKIFENAGHPRVNVLYEFVEGLMSLVSDKLRSDLKNILGGVRPNTDQLFAHHVDEALSFHAEMSSSFSSPGTFSGCLKVLVEEEIFEKWLSIEKEVALRKMDGMFSMKDAWSVQGMSGDDNDDGQDVKLPQFAELFLMLLATIQDRYAFLPSVDCQLKFCQLQLYLVDDFRIRLFQIRKQVAAETGRLFENAKYMTILNTVAFLVEFLRKWSDDPFYIKLSYHRRRMDSMDGNRGNNGMLDTKRSSRSNDLKSGSDDDDDDDLKDVGNPGSSFHSDDSRILLADASIFDGMIELYERMTDEMMTKISGVIFKDFEENCRPYVKDKWLALPSQKEFSTLILSNSSCSMLRCLKSHLEEMEEMLNRSLFTSLWKNIAQSIDDHVFNNVICVNRFNEGGAVQLNFDMTRNLFPLFLRYTNKPENFFKSIKEACIILTMAPGSALLIRDVLRRALHPSEVKVDVTDPVATLHDIGVFKLHLEQVELLLSLRVDLQST